jgi:hypothetical protein
VVGRVEVLNKCENVSAPDKIEGRVVSGKLLGPTESEMSPLGHLRMLSSLFTGALACSLNMSGHWIDPEDIQAKSLDELDGVLPVTTADIKAYRARTEVELGDIIVERILSSRI